MNLQVLVSTMNQTDSTKLIERMNLQTEAFIVNQCDKNNFEVILYKGNKIQVMSLDELGVGLSRNTALMRANGDICLFADDDLVYVDGYENLIIEEFKKNTNADIILFNVPSTNCERPTYEIKKNGRVRKYNCFRYGAVNIAARTESLRVANVCFSLLFGGGARYSSGEDSMFIFDSLKKGLKIYSSTKEIGYVSQEKSSWFTGYNDKYFIDKGIFYANVSKRWAKLLSLQFVLRHRKMFEHEKTWIEAYKLMIKNK